MNKSWPRPPSNILSGLSQEELDEALKIIRVRSFRAGELLHDSEDMEKCLFVIQLGRVQAHQNWPGTEPAQAVYTPGGLLGGRFLSKKRPIISRAVALDDVVVCRLLEENLHQLAQRFPGLAQQLIHSAVE